MCECLQWYWVLWSVSRGANALCSVVWWLWGKCCCSISLYKRTGSIVKLGQNVPVLFIQEKNKRKTNNQLKLPEAESFPFQGHLRVHVSTACSIAGRFLVFLLHSQDLWTVNVFPGWDWTINCTVPYWEIWWRTFSKYDKNWFVKSVSCGNVWDQGSI